MVLEKIDKKNLVQRLVWLIMGKQRPNFLTRISVIAGFIVWLYLLSWHILVLLSTTLIDTVHKSSYVRAAFTTVGSKYGLVDPLNQLLANSFVQVIVYLVILVGLILIWRRKKIGFLMVIFSYLATFILTFFILGLKYLLAESSIVDLVLIFSSVLYFALGLFLFSKWKSPDNQTSAELLS